MICVPGFDGKGLRWTSLTKKKSAIQQIVKVMDKPGLTSKSWRSYLIAKSNGVHMVSALMVIIKGFVALDGSNGKTPLKTHQDPEQHPQLAQHEGCQ